MSRYDDDRDRYRRRSPSPRGRYSDFGRRDDRDDRDRRDRYRETPPRRDYRDRSPPRGGSGTFGDEMRRRDQGRGYRDDYRRDDRRDYNRGSGGYGGGGRDTDRYGQRRNFGDSGPKHRSQPQRTKFSLLISNLSSTFSWQDLKDIGRRHGDVSFADCNKVKRGEGILTFHDRESMVRCKEAMDGTEQKGSMVRVDFEFPETADPTWTGDTNNDHPGYYTNKDRSPRRDRDRSRTRSRSPPRDRSRSRTRSPSPKREREASASPARDD